MKIVAPVFLVAGLAALLLGLFGFGIPPTANVSSVVQRGKSPPRPRQVPDPDVRGEPVFEFEKRTGEVDKALTVMLRLGLSVPDNAARAEEVMSTVAKARETLRSNSKGAATAVIAELDKLRSDDIQGHAALFSLLGIVGDEDAAIRYWSKKLTAGSPRQHRPTPRGVKSKQPDQPRLRKSEQRDPERLIRYLAIAQLYRVALRGNEKSRIAILDAARSPHRDVKVSAVQYTYALNKNRWKARNDLKSRLAASDHYLLYRY